MKSKGFGLITYEYGKPRPWRPSGPTREATAGSRRERRIVDLILCGELTNFTQAVELMRKPCDYKHIFELGVRYKRTGRVIKAVVVANKIFSGEIPANETQARIRGLAASAGTP